jgi:hypothetical protein
LGSARPPDNRNAVAFVDRKIGGRLEQGFPIAPVQRDDEKRASGEGLELADGRPDAPAAFFGGGALIRKSPPISAGPCSQFDFWPSLTRPIFRQCPC